MSSLAVAQGFRVETGTVRLSSDTPTEFVDITDEVQRLVEESGLLQGLAVVFSVHTTAGVIVNEAEPLLLEDMTQLLDRFAPRTASYRHDDLSVRTVNLEPNERTNGHAHCQRLLIPASESIPIVDGRLRLGRWQRVFFVELDGPRDRQVTVQLLGS